MATQDETWKEDIKKKLIQLYGSKSATPDTNGLMGLLFFLDKTEQELGEGSANPFWKTLRIAYQQDDDDFLKEYTDRMIIDAGEWKKDPNFLAALMRIYDRMADPNSASHQELVEYSIESVSGAELGVGTALAKAWDGLTPLTKKEVVTVIKELATNYRALNCVDEAVSLVDKTGGAVVMVGLAAISLTFKCWINLRLWWKGEISGKRCAKNCVNSLVEISGGVGGGFAGAAIGSMIFPGVGTAIGGIIGGLVGGTAAQMLADRLTLKIFDLPKKQAEEDAYKFLGVHHTSSNNEVNKAYRAKALKYHPDKGGSVEDFWQLEHQMGIIKLAREGV